MAAGITTVTKTASVVKTTKGSEKKWSEVLSMNRRHDLQLPIDLARYDHDLKRTYNFHQRQKIQTERLWAHKHETWYQDDFLFRNHLLKQLKPITRRFKHMSSLSLQDNLEQQRTQTSDEDEIEALPLQKEFKRASMEELPPLKPTRKLSTIQHYTGDNIRQSNPVLSKLVCPKVLNKHQPRLHSHTHAKFLDVAQRFLKHNPELIEKSVDNKDKHKQQKQHFKLLIDNEQERTKLAAIKFRQDLDDEKNKENNSDDYFDDDDFLNK